MKQYLDLLQDILDNGVWKKPAREGMPPTKEVFCRTMTFDLQKGFPLLTTKKMFTKGIIAELLWFLRGDTNIKFLLDNGTHIWNKDAYKYYKRLGGDLSMEDFLVGVHDGATSPNIPNYTYGDCGNIYGYQWRKNGIDQITHLIKSIKETPDSRYHLVSAWNPSDFLGEDLKAALPACHLLFQCSVTNGKLDMMMLQRSCDTFLGVPFNIASYAMLCHLIARETDLEVGTFTWVGNSVHLYETHIDAAKLQLTREPLPLCKLHIVRRGSLDIYQVSDFIIEGYSSHSKISAELSVGI